jgi:CheY-like chemotaxis protein
LGDASVNPRTILHIEDNPGDARLLQEAIAEAGVGIATVVAENGVRAIEHLHQLSEDPHGAMPHGILLDLNMPVMGGLTFLRIISRHDEWRTIPVVVLSSSQREDEIQQARSLGAVGYVIKPDCFDDYLALARRLAKFPLVEPTPWAGHQLSLI